MNQTPVSPTPHAVPLRTTVVHHDPGAAATALLLDEERERRERHDSVEWRKRAHVAGRCALGAMFVIGALAKAFTFQASAALIGNLGLVYPAFLMTLIIAVELVGGLMLFAGLQTRRVSLGLIGYLAMVTLVAHSDFSNDFNRVFALSNIAFAGALLMLFANGAGDLSADKWLRQRAVRQELAN